MPVPITTVQYCAKGPTAEPFRDSIVNDAIAYASAVSSIMAKE